MCQLRGPIHSLQDPRLGFLPDKIFAVRCTALWTCSCVGKGKQHLVTGSYNCELCSRAKQIGSLLSSWTARSRPPQQSNRHQRCVRWQCAAAPATQQISADQQQQPKSKGHKPQAASDKGGDRKITPKTEDYSRCLVVKHSLPAAGATRKCWVARPQKFARLLQVVSGYSQACRACGLWTCEGHHGYTSLWVSKLPFTLVLTHFSCIHHAGIDFVLFGL